MDQAQLFAEDLARMRASSRTLQQRIARGSARRKILVADDEVALCRLVAATLNADNYEILEAGRGTEALVLAQSERPDLILLDVHMPELDGLEVCRRIKADEALRNTPVVMLTAASQQVDLEAGYAAGADSYLTKPFSPLELLEVIQQQLIAAAAESEDTSTP